MLCFIPPVIAHRGASAYAPENTLIAFAKAAQLGIKWVEFDVVLAACDTPVVFHDEILDRTTNGHGMVNDYPYAILRTLDAGSWFAPIYANETIPTLQQICEFLKNAQMSANVELKCLPGQEEPLVQNVLKQMAGYLAAPAASILFSSFSWDALYCLRKHSADCHIGLLMHEWLPDWEQHCTALQCVSVNVNQEIMTEKAAKYIKGMNKFLLCYTVNDPLRAKELYAWGVDAVFSDCPDKILTEVDKTGS